MYKPKVIPTLLIGAVTPAQIHAVHIAIQASPTVKLMSDNERLAINDSYLEERAYRPNGELV